MTQVDQVRELRGAVCRRDGAAVVRLLRADGEPPWQLVGDGVAIALGQQVDGAHRLAAECIASLRERDWIGDAELADQLDGLAGTGPAPLLRPLPVDLEMVTEILEGDPLTAGGALDLHTGEVWPRAAVEYANEDGVDVEAPDFDDADRFRWVDGDSRDGYRVDGVVRLLWSDGPRLCVSPRTAGADVVPRSRFPRSAEWSPVSSQEG